MKRCIIAIAAAVVLCGCISIGNGKENSAKIEISKATWDVSSSTGMYATSVTVADGMTVVVPKTAYIPELCKEFDEITKGFDYNMPSADYSEVVVEQKGILIKVYKLEDITDRAQESANKFMKYLKLIEAFRKKYCRDSAFGVSPSVLRCGWDPVVYDGCEIDSSGKFNYTPKTEKKK